MTTQFITDANGKKVSIILSIKDYQKMIEKLEDLDDIRLFNEAKAEGGESIPFDDYLKSRKRKK
jgi:hypothetical protein